MKTVTGDMKAVVTLPSDTQILITREFDAPKHLVYRAFTEPELVMRWWASDKGETTLAETDLRVGGAWRWVMIANEGFEVGFHGEFLEIVPDELISRTEIYEGYPDEVAKSRLTLREVGAKTTIEMLVEHTNKFARDMHIESGMEDGLQKALILLEEVAISLK